MEYKVMLMKDESAGVWVAESDDIPGLILESDSLDTLVKKTRIAALELLEISSKMTDANLRFSLETTVLAA